MKETKGLIVQTGLGSARISPIGTTGNRNGFYTQEAKSAEREWIRTIRVYLRHPREIFSQEQHSLVTEAQLELRMDCFVSRRGEIFAMTNRVSASLCLVSVVPLTP